ncbi:hypothetical protein MJO28_003758, partial [Puccinia striiformis f. sp. tritici]
MEAEVKEDDVVDLDLLVAGSHKTKFKQEDGTLRAVSFFIQYDNAEKYASRITSNNSLESYPYNLGNSGLAACLSVLRIFNQPTAAPIAHFLDYKVVPWISPSSPLKSKPPLDREDKVAQVSVKIIKTEDCIHSYAK